MRLYVFSVKFNNEKTVHEYQDQLALMDLPNYHDITYLNCSHGNLHKLHEPLPNSLKYLICPYNKLSCLPELPSNLLSLNCEGNLLTKLPKLPDKLDTLLCGKNLLSYLPDLPDSLLELYCESNKLIYFPNLPKRIYEEYEFVFPTIYDDGMCYYYFKNNPIADFIVKYFNRNVHQYNIWKKKMDTKFVIKIEKWFLECKYNPKYKYCRNRLKNEYNEMYNLNRSN